MEQITVLVVQEKRSEFEKLGKLLEKDSQFHFEVSHQKNSSDIFNILDRKRFDILLLGSKKAIINSLDLVETLRFEFPDIALVACIPSHDIKLGRMAMDSGIEDFIYACDHSPELLTKALFFAKQKKSKDQKLRALTEEVTKLRQAINQSFNVIVITDPLGRIQYVNKRFEVITGYKKEEVIGANPRVLKSGYQSKAFYKEMWDTISSGKVWTGELVNKKKNGTLYSEKATISPVLDHTGKIQSYIAVKEDITELKTIRESNALANSKVDTLFQRSPIAALVVDLNGFIIDSNEEGNKLLGLEKSQLSKLTYYDESWGAKDEFGNLLTFENYPITKTLKTSQPQKDFKLSFHNAELEETTWLSVDTVPLFEGGDSAKLIGVYVVMNNITTKVKETEEQDITGLRLKFTEEVGLVGHWEKDLETNITTWSDNSCEIFGFDISENKKSFEDFIQIVLPEDREKVEKVFSNSVLQKEQASVEYRIRLSDGTIKYIEDSWFFIDRKPNDKGKILGIVHDISALKITQKRAMRSESWLKAILESNDDLVFVLDDNGVFLDFF